MDREYVESTNIKSIGFDITSSTLEVEFHSGAVWQYYDVLENIFYEMKTSSSIGKFFNVHIKGKYPESRVE